MNWKFTRPNKPVAFGENEPFCTVFPIKRGLIESVVPEFRELDSDTEHHPRAKHG
jgi:Family of unknown function (DUF6065)